MKNQLLHFLASLNKVRLTVSCLAFVLSLCVVHSANALTFAQTPLFVGQNAKPNIMLAMSRDQELFYTAYPDYSNLDGGFLRMEDTTYRNDFQYAGYYDPLWCYSYSADATTANSKFVPDALAVNHKCTANTTGRWSGNFLNWATMTRMDILRKVLYGGLRSVDTAASGSTLAETVLERAFVPKDSHAFVKVYKTTGINSIADFTPYSDNTLSFCSVSNSSTGYPLVRIAVGDWSQWSHTEQQQCQWRGATTTYSTSPHTTTDRKAELVVKVKVCVPGKDGEPNEYNDTSNKTGRCKSYQAGSFKPIGLLQKFYTDVNFGLVTGTTNYPDKGGVLRKKAGRMAGNTFSGTDTINEFAESTGVFNGSVDKGIIKTINGINIKNFSYTATDGAKSYNNNSDWRNPIGEIYAETLRYVLGKASPTSAFDGTDSWLTKESTWNDPVPSSSWCSKCSIIVISSGPNSFDGDDLSSSLLTNMHSSLSRTSLNLKTDDIGLKEFGALSNKVFYGGTSVSTQCSPQTKKMSELIGKCPEFPISGGTYDIAGLAYWAHTTDVRTATGYSGTQSITTYAVELSEGLPTMKIPVGDNVVSFVPICTNNNKSNSCSLVGSVVENITNDSNGKPISGSYLFYWEDQPWASDYDLDAVQRLQFCVGSACGGGVAANQIKITNTLPYWATGTSNMHMSYIMSGAKDATNTTSEDKLQDTQYVFRGGYTQHKIKNASNVNIVSSLGSWEWYNTILPQGTDPLPANDGTTAIYSTSKIFTAATSALVQVNTPLYYAAKYGSFKNDATNSNGNGIPDVASEWDVKNLQGASVADGIPDNYFMMKNPALLESSLYNIFSDAVEGVSSGTGVSTNSTKLEEGTRIYQARFESKSWYGELRSLKAATSSTSDYDEVWTTLGKITGSAGRNIFSSVGGAGIVFNDTNFATKYTSAQKAALGGSTEGPKVINWIRGDDVTGFRSRNIGTLGKQVMGDIVNSTPVYAGAASQGYDKLASAYGSSAYKAFVEDKKDRKDVVYVGANDGMLHAIDADTGNELFAYVPSMVYSKLPLLASTSYGSATSHTYTVDGPVTVGDAYVNGSWKTILVGTLGAGERGIFVLDVTDPENFSTANVLFEITPSNYPSIGNVVGKPLIAPVGGRWKIIFGNGYNSTGGTADLFVIDLQYPTNPLYSRAISTGSTSNNGLSRPTALQDSVTGAVKYVYSGDLLGNMWKFDVSSATVASWNIVGSAPIFQAKDDSGNPQPIFSAPTLGVNSYLPTATMVYFGTGKYIETDDVDTTQMGRVQSFYGLADTGTALTYSSLRTEILHKKTMTTTGNTRDVDDSGTSAVRVNWATKKGWYLDFPAGERIVSKSLLLYDRLIFSTIVPINDVCSFGGSGWLMELVGVGDAYGTDKELLATNGIFEEFFLPGDLIKLKGDDGTHVTKCNIKGDCEDLLLNDPATTVSGLGRVSWRQLK